jgi:hypothetical protein
VPEVPARLASDLEPAGSGSALAEATRLPLAFHCPDFYSREDV